MQYRNIVSEPSSNEPGHKRMRIEDYLDTLNGYYGEMVAQQARLLQILETAQDRSAILVFQPSEIVFATGAVPPSLVQRKVIPGYAQWRSFFVAPLKETNADVPSTVVFFDELLYYNPNAGVGGSWVPMPLLRQPQTVGLWLQSGTQATGAIEIILSTRDVR